MPITLADWPPPPAPLSTVAPRPTRRHGRLHLAGPHRPSRMIIKNGHPRAERAQEWPRTVIIRLVGGVGRPIGRPAGPRVTSR